MMTGMAGIRRTGRLDWRFTLSGAVSTSEGAMVAPAQGSRAGPPRTAAASWPPGSGGADQIETAATNR